MKPFSLSASRCTALLLLAAAVALPACKEKPADPKGVSLLDLQKKQLEAARDKISSLEKDMVRLDGERRAAVEQLRLNQQRPEVTVPQRLSSVLAESTALLGWLKSSKKVNATSTSLEDSTDLGQVVERSRQCLQTAAEIIPLYEDVRTRNLASPEDMNAMTVQKEWLETTCHQLQELTKDLP